MSTDAPAVAAILAAVDLPGLGARPMFGEHGVFLDDRMVGLICAGRLYVKPVPGARAALPGAPDKVPFEGGRRAYLAADLGRDPPDALRAAFRAAKAELPPTRRRKP